MRDYSELRKLADEATIGPWEFRATKDSSGIRFVVAPEAAPTVQGFEYIPADCSHKNNGQYIAAANPQTITTILDELDALRALKDSVERLEIFSSSGSGFSYTVIKDIRTALDNWRKVTEGSDAEAT